jgi:hypothetical protein
MPDDVYKKYTMRRERSLFVELKGEDDSTSSMSIEDKLWYFSIIFPSVLCTIYFRSFTYSPSDKTLSLKVAMHHSDDNRPIAECIFWYWNDKEIDILEVGN